MQDFAEIREARARVDCQSAWPPHLQGHELTPKQHGYVVEVIWRWIERELGPTPIPA